MLTAECDTRLSQLAIITITSPYTEQVTIPCHVMMSLPMYLSNDGVIVIVWPY